MKRQLLAPFAVLALAACDGTLNGTHSTRGHVPEVYADAPLPASSESHVNEPTMIRAQHLVVMHRDSRNAPPVIVRSKAEAKARAEQALQLLRDGANPDEIMAKYSDEPGAAERHGDLGRFSRKQMVKKFSEAAFKLKPGEVSEVIETEFGFHVIRRLE
jgi:hypothetical protein